MAAVPLLSGVLNKPPKRGKMGDRVYPYLGGVLMNVYLLVELLLGVLWFLHYLFFFAFAFRFNVAALQADMKMIYI